jgi:hypothetical protein
MILAREWRVFGQSFCARQEETRAVQAGLDYRLAVGVYARHIFENVHLLGGEQALQVQRTGVTDPVFFQKELNQRRSKQAGSGYGDNIFFSTYGDRSQAEHE